MTFPTSWVAVQQWKKSFLSEVSWPGDVGGSLEDEKVEEIDPEVASTDSPNSSGTSFTANTAQTAARRSLQAG